MDGENRFTMIAEDGKAMIAEYQTELVFALGVKTAMTSVAGVEFRVLLFFASDEFGMNFEHFHENSP